jgi:hypothetical protein
MLPAPALPRIAVNVPESMGPVHGADACVPADAVVASARIAAVAATNEIGVTTIRG